MWEKILFIFSSLLLFKSFSLHAYHFHFQILRSCFRMISVGLCSMYFSSKYFFFLFLSSFYQIVASCNCIEIPHRCFDIAKVTNKKMTALWTQTVQIVLALFAFLFFWTVCALCWMLLPVLRTLAGWKPDSIEHWPLG